jgi:putative transposase
MVEQMVSEKIEVNLTCVVLEVSRSGYYAWMMKPEGVRSLENASLVVEIKKIHDESRGTYGLPRICKMLELGGKKLGKARVARLMKIIGVSGVFERRFKIKTTDSKHDNPIAARIFKTEEQETFPTKPNQIWTSDITYVWTDEGFLFLATYLDIFTRKIVGFSMADHMRTELLLDALDMALGRQQLITSELLSHSDRGSQYASDVYRERLNSLSITASMSRKGNCYDNAFAETFFGTLKNELVYRTRFKTRVEAMTAIFEYIEVFYNRKRIHSSLGYLTPVAYEAAQLAA